MTIQDVIDTLKYVESDDEGIKSTLNSVIDRLTRYLRVYGDIKISKRLARHIRDVDRKSSDYKITKVWADRLTDYVCEWAKKLKKGQGTVEAEDQEGGHDEKGRGKTAMNSKRSMRKNPLFWVVFCFFIGMLIFSLVAAFIPEETMPRWVSYVFSPVGAVGSCLQIALSLREWRSDSKHGEEEAKTTDKSVSDFSIRIDDRSKHDDHRKYDDHRKDIFVGGDINKPLSFVSVVAIVCATIFGICALCVLAIVFTHNKGGSTTTVQPNASDYPSQSMPPSSTPPSAGETPENPLIEYEGFDVVVNEDGETVTVSINTQKEGAEIEFPSYIQKEDGKVYRVTVVGRAGLSRNDKITAVNLSTSIERIESGAFANFSALKEIFLSENVTYIGRNAFLGCTNLKTVNVDDLKEWYSMTFDGENSNPLSLNSDSFLTVGGKPISGEQVIKGIGFIPNYTFQNTAISQVAFESDVTEIGERAFYNCKQLGTVWDKCALNIEKGSTANGYVGYYANHIYTVDTETGRIATDDGYIFDESETPSLVEYRGIAEQLMLPDSTPHGLSYGIAGEAFRDCANITSIVIPDSVTSIGEAAFCGCSGLESITIPFVGDSRKTAEDAYQYPFGYIFGTAEFDDASAVWQLYHNGLNSALSDTYYIPDALKSVTVTGGEILLVAFYNCKGLTRIVIPDDATSIGDYAFHGCSGLTSIEISNNVTSIGGGAFYGCSGLTSIEIPDSVTSIGKCAFEGCSGLTSMTIPFVGATKDGIQDTYFGYIFGPNGFSYNYENVPASLKKVIITGGAVIGDAAFRDCSGLTSIEIPNSVISIGGGAFCRCRGLTSIEIPDSVISIGDEAFRDCSSLGGAMFGKESKMNSIGKYAFVNCTGLMSIEIPDSVTEIGNQAFEGCSGLEKIYWNAENCIRAGDHYFAGGFDFDYTIFRDCTALKVVCFGENVKSIPPYLFCKREGLTSITIPDSVTEIGDDAFYGCPIEEATMPTSAIPFIPQNSLKRVVLTSGDSIKKSAFYNCSGLMSISIADSVTSIGELAFYKCKALKSIEIPSNVVSIGSEAFEGCSSLTNVKFENSIGWYAHREGTDVIVHLMELGNPSSAAKSLTEYYSTYSWVRS